MKFKSTLFPNLVALFVHSIGNPKFTKCMVNSFKNLKYLYLGSCSTVESLLLLKLDELKLLFPSVIQIYRDNTYYNNFDEMYI